MAKHVADRKLKQDSQGVGAAAWRTVLGHWVKQTSHQGCTIEYQGMRHRTIQGHCGQRNLQGLRWLGDQLKEQAVDNLKWWGSPNQDIGGCTNRRQDARHSIRQCTQG